jgi:glycosyltransferase involved in cell wall biosynthesis
VPKTFWNHPFESFDNMPKVTVITPNYNHSRYLPQRLDSILAQTFEDFELIILDDASTDNSREIIESYANDPRVKTIFNAENNGNTFKQWNLGLTHARGEYIWFAESDDYADPTLLETLVDRLDRHANVGLAYCQSWVVDENSNKLFNYNEYLELLNGVSQWRSDYIISGQDECTTYLFWYNTIPNASAVLLRRVFLDRSGGVPREMLMCGDWMTYVNVLSISDIAFISQPLNYYRQHGHTVRARLYEKKVPLDETWSVQRVLMKRYGRRKLMRNGRQILPFYVNTLINISRRPPYNKVPAGKSLELLGWCARIHPRAFRIALQTLSWELMAHLSYCVGLLGLAQKVKHAITRSTQ